MAAFQKSNGIAEGEEWSRSAGLAIAADTLDGFLAQVPFNAKGTRRQPSKAVPVTPLALPEIKGVHVDPTGFRPDPAGDCPI